MNDFLPKDLVEGLAAARKRKARKDSRLRVKAGGQTIQILRHWDGGFAVDAEETQHLRGLVDVFDGATRLSQCLIVASSEEAGERVYEVKRETRVSDQAATDYVRDPKAPIALLT
jgi:hypothetical protein